MNAYYFQVSTSSLMGLIIQDTEKGHQQVPTLFVSPPHQTNHESSTATSTAL